VAMKTAPSIMSAAPALALVVNGARATYAARTLADLLVEMGYAGATVATARNGDFVPAKLRATTVLMADDTIEIVSPRQGG
jgi:sulfur carrier protein